MTTLYDLTVLIKEGRMVFFLRGGERGRGGGEAGTVLDTVSGTRVAVVPYLPKRGGWSSFCGVVRGDGEEGRRAQYWTQYQERGRTADW